MLCGYPGCTKSASVYFSMHLQVYYCTKVHKRAHWKQHKNKTVCAPEEVDTTTAVANDVVPPEDIIREVENLEPEFPFRMVEMKGKGLGVIATRDIKCGELVYKETLITDPYAPIRTLHLTNVKDDGDTV